jgi:hypothetical protein
MHFLDASWRLGAILLLVLQFSDFEFSRQNSNNLHLAFKTMVMPTSHQPPCCSLQPDYTTPSLNPEVNRFVLSKKYLPPIVLGILEQSYKSLHHLRTPECLPYSRRKMLALNLALEF